MNILNEIQEQRTDAQLVADELGRQIRSTWARCLSAHKRGMATLWSSLPEGVEPQDVIDELGTDAADVFALSAALAQLIATVDADAVVGVPEGVTVTANPDGTVTLS